MNVRRHGCWSVLLIAAAVPVQAGQIRIWSTADVTADDVRLADVAWPEGEVDGLPPELAGVVVYPAPRPGGSLLVRLDDVRAALAEAGVNLATVEFVGASHCRVSRPPEPVAAPAPRSARSPTSTLSSRRSILAATPGRDVRPASHKDPISCEPAQRTLADVLLDYITGRLGDLGGRVEVRFSPANQSDLDTPAADYQFDIRPRDERRLGLVGFDVHFLAGGRVVRSLPLIAEAALVREVVVARRPINRGQPILGRDLKFEPRRFTDPADVGITDLAAVVGQHSNRFVRAGEMLVSQMIAVRPLVQRGDAVTVWMRRGGVVIKTTGRAQQAGALGETIEVARDGTRRSKDLIEAMVTGPGTVTAGAIEQIAQH